MLDAMQASRQSAPAFFCFPFHPDLNGRSHRRTIDEQLSLRPLQQSAAVNLLHRPVIADDRKNDR